MSIQKTYAAQNVLSSGTQLQPVLQPLDEVTFDLANGSLYHQTDLMRNLYPGFGAPPAFCNGTLRRQINCTSADRELVVPIQWSYPMLSGELNIVLTPNAPDVDVAISTDGVNFELVPNSNNNQQLTVGLTAWIARQEKKSAVYSFTLKFCTRDSSPLRQWIVSSSLVCVFQFSPTAIAKLVKDDNRLSIVITPANQAVDSQWSGLEIVHEWTEASSVVESRALVLSQTGDTPSDLVGLAASFTPENLVLTLMTRGSRIERFIIYLDNDGNVQTGYAPAFYGAEYLVQGNSLFKYSSYVSNVVPPWIMRSDDFIINIFYHFSH